MFKYDTTAPFTVTYCPTWYRSLLEIFFPSSSHEISGVGFPCAIHRKNTDGPGWRVSSLKASLMTGGSNLPPNFNSALACALSWSFRMKHWYIPLFSFFTDSILKTGSECLIDLPSLVQLIVLIGFPEKWQVNTAGRPKSTTCVCGSIFAERGAVTVNTVSTLSPPTELFTTHKYFPESSTTASLMMSVPDTCLTRSLRTTADLRVVPSMYLYHLLGEEKRRNGIRTKYFLDAFQRSKITFVSFGKIILINHEQVH